MGTNPAYVGFFASTPGTCFLLTNTDWVATGKSRLVFNDGRPLDDPEGMDHYIFYSLAGVYSAGIANNTTNARMTANVAKLVR